MYELKNGSKRLVRALHDLSFNNANIIRLAHLLNYQESQLGEDIRALYDLIILENEKD